MSWLARLGIAAAIALAAWGALNWYGNTKYQAGRDYERQQAGNAAEKQDKQFRQTEGDERDGYDERKEREEKRLAVLQAERDELAGNVGGLQRSIQIHKSRVSALTSDNEKLLAASAIGIDLFDDCQRKYTDLAGETASLASRVNYLLEEIRAEEEGGFRFKSGMEWVVVDP